MTESLFDLPPVARARRTDPPESHEAAKSVTELTARQNAVLECLRFAAIPLSDPELADQYRVGASTFEWPEQSDSGLRTRRAELVKRQLVEKTGTTRLKTGRTAALWSVTDQGKKLNTTKGAKK